MANNCSDMQPTSTSAYIHKYVQMCSELADKCQFLLATLSQDYRSNELAIQGCCKLRRKTAKSGGEMLSKIVQKRYTDTDEYTHICMYIYSSM